MPSKVPEKFNDFAKYLVDFKKESGDGLHNTVQRPWMDFYELFGPVRNEDLVASNIFDRTDANTKFIQAFNKEDAVEADLSVSKLAADFLSACERDFGEMRKRTRVRMMVHAGVRDRCNGDQVEGALANNTYRFLSAIENTKKVGPQ